MSGTSQSVLTFKAEASYDATPATGVRRAMRYVSSGLKESVDYIQSPEINPSREPIDQTKINTHCEGPIGGVMSYDNAHIQIIGGVMLNDINANAGTSSTTATISLTAASNTIDDTSGTGALYTASPFITGDWMYVSGTASNGAFKAKCAEAYISGTMTSYVGTLVPRSGATLGSLVTGVTSGATGELISSNLSTTFKIKVKSGTFLPTETVQLTTTFAVGGGTDQMTLTAITSSGAVLSCCAPVVSESAGASITIKRLSTLYPGKTTRSFTIEMNQSDVSSAFELFTGCMFTSFQVSSPPKGPVTTSIGVKAKKRVLSTTSVQTTLGGSTAPDTNQMENAEQSCTVFMGGSEAVLVDLTGTGTTGICSTALPHLLQTGDYIIISNNGSINGVWPVTRLTSTTFQVASGTVVARLDAAAGEFRRLKTAASVVDWSFNLQNELQEETEQGTAGFISQPLGELTITGQMNRYFKDLNDQRRFHDDEYTGVAFVITDPTDPSKFYVWEFVRIKYTDAPAPIGGNNQRRISAITFAAAIDPTENHTARFCY